MIDLDKIKEKAQSGGVTTNFILKEYIHFFVLDYLFKSGYFSHLVFQGGTALRLAYGGVRYSEDLDFVLRRKNSQFLDSLTKGMKHLIIYLDKLLPFARNIQLKTQKDTSNFKRFTLILEIEMFKRKDKTHIEILNIPSYDNQVVIIHRQDFPSRPAINVETPQEILSDKFVAIGLRDYLKGRDIWDIYFILNTLKISLSRDILKMVEKKIVDYGMELEEFNLKFEDASSLLKDEGEYVLKQEMDKFLPIFYRKSFEDKYKGISEEVLNACLWLRKEIKQ